VPHGKAAHGGFPAVGGDDLGHACYLRTSFAQMAKRAGLSSTGMISYYFRGKDDLMVAVVKRCLLLAANPDTDIGTYTHELVAIFERAPARRSAHESVRRQRRPARDAPAGVHRHLKGEVGRPACT
jgi:AcrR family transcriptional regulator